MSTDPSYPDEILSAIIDGEADAETVAAVQADPDASARLAHMRRAVELVAAPVPEATPERRSASIAAAMAAATPQAPEVTSLAAARHERATPARPASSNNRQWLALAAAAVALVVAIPLVLQFRSENDAETATDVAAESADDTTDRASFDAGDSGEDATAASDDSADDADAMEADDAMEEEAMEEDDSAMAASDGDAEAADEPAQEEPADEPAEESEADPVEAEERLVTAPPANSLENIEQLISLGSITPLLTIDQLAEVEVAPECVDAQLAELPPELLDSPIFDIAFLTEEGVAPRLVVVRFDDDGTTTTLDAEDCAQLG